ncbi:MAG TPA: hypothetical protein GXZ46_02050 [Actinomycetales bacterium]|nr:hypothetical protein [Actinomycetales bacterium]
MMPGDYDADTTGDFDENTLDGSEGLDGDLMTGDGENYVMDAPDRWRGAEPHDTLNKRLAEENPDFDPDYDPDVDPEGRYGDVDGHEDFEFGTPGDRDPDRNRRLGYTES